MSAYEGKQPPRWTTSWPEWYGIEGNTQVVPASDYDALADRVEAVERALDKANMENVSLRGLLGWNDDQPKTYFNPNEGFGPI